MTRVFAVDWSGARTGASRRIWVAEADPSGTRIARLENGRSRVEVAELLVREAERSPSMAVGLDFGFSFPGWFLDRLGVEEAPELWALAERDGERWLRECAPPFWGRPGKPRPDTPEPHRRTERDVAERGGGRPRSVFQIGGAGSVGTGSVRGMPVLLRLRAAGFSVWPFDPPGEPVAVELYPRLLTGPVVKSDPAARRAHLSRYPALNAATRAAMAASEDAFDAGVSALEAARARLSAAGLRPARDRVECREGAIWTP